ncbi:uncharacterized protein LOC128957526 [Oppia nitens]|uniref:uncharacterized protein LOC128957526 n=1 Tax=Oppia nitens TaxID=1686743 RepID=UPI0023DC27A7|nr:uncharacterized protein LOC128957526 [Oppia nitens]
MILRKLLLLRNLIKVLCLTALVTVDHIDCIRRIGAIVCSFSHHIHGYNKIYCLDEDRPFCCYSNSINISQSLSLVDHFEENITDVDNNITDKIVSIAYCCDFKELKNQNYGLFLIITITSSLNGILFVILIVAIIALIVLCCMKPKTSTQRRSSSSVKVKRRVANNKTEAKDSQKSNENIDKCKKSIKTNSKQLAKNNNDSNETLPPNDGSNESLN